MSIKFLKGNMFDSKAEALVNTVNCEGYMGKGIAYQFKQRFPENDKKYVEKCRTGELRPGTILCVSEGDRIIVNFPTKDKWREPSRIEYIIDGLKSLKKEIEEHHIKSIAIPPLGCGNGGLLWDEVKKYIVNELQDVESDVYLYEPQGNGKAVKEQMMTANDLMLLYVRQKLENATSLRFQKTIFFVNYYVGKTVFSFSRGKYGPYSKQLYHEAVRIGEYQKTKGFETADKTFDAIYQVICSKKVDAEYSKLKLAADKALALVNKITDELMLEGMATVFYLINDEKHNGHDEIIKEFKNWSEDKAQRFKSEMIDQCIDMLDVNGFIDVDLFRNYTVVKA